MSKDKAIKNPNYENGFVTFCNGIFYLQANGDQTKLFYLSSILKEKPVFIYLNQIPLDMVGYISASNTEKLQKIELIEMGISNEDNRTPFHVEIANSIEKLRSSEAEEPNKIRNKDRISSPTEGIQNTNQDISINHKGFVMYQKNMFFLRVEGENAQIFAINKQQQIQLPNNAFINKSTFLDYDDKIITLDKHIIGDDRSMETKIVGGSDPLELTFHVN